MTLKDKYSTVSEVAKEFGVTRQTVYRWIRDGKVKTETVGKARLINKKSLAIFLAKKVEEIVSKYRGVA